MRLLPGALYVRSPVRWLSDPPVHRSVLRKDPASKPSMRPGSISGSRPRLLERWDRLAQQDGVHRHGGTDRGQYGYCGQCGDVLVHTIAPAPCTSLGRGRPTSVAGELPTRRREVCYKCADENDISDRGATGTYAPSAPHDSRPGPEPSANALFEEHASMSIEEEERDAAAAADNAERREALERTLSTPSGILSEVSKMCRMRDGRPEIWSVENMTRRQIRLRAMVEQIEAEGVEELPTTETPAGESCGHAADATPAAASVHVSNHDERLAAFGLDRKKAVRKKALCRATVDQTDDHALPNRPVSPGVASCEPVATISSVRSSVAAFDRRMAAFECEGRYVSFKDTGEDDMVEDMIRKKALCRAYHNLQADELQAADATPGAATKRGDMLQYVPPHMLMCLPRAPTHDERLAAFGGGDVECEETLDATLKRSDFGDYLLKYLPAASTHDERPAAFPCEGRNVSNTLDTPQLVWEASRGYRAPVTNLITPTAARLEPGHWQDMQPLHRNIFLEMD